MLKKLEQLTQKHVLQNSEQVFEMNRQDVKLTFIGGMIFVLGGFIFAFVSLVLGDGIPYESIKLVIAEIPAFLSQSWPVVAVMTGVFLLIFLSLTRHPYYIRFDLQGIHVRTSLRSAFGRGERLYSLPSKEQFTWKLITNGRAGTRTIQITVDDLTKKHKIYLSGDVFGHYGIDALVKWLTEYYPNQKV